MLVESSLSPTVVVVAYVAWVGFACLLGDGLSRASRSLAVKERRYAALVRQAAIFVLFASLFGLVGRSPYLALAMLAAAFASVRVYRRELARAVWTEEDQRGAARHCELRTMLERAPPLSGSETSPGHPEGTGAESPIEARLELAIAKALKDPSLDGSVLLELRTQVPVGSYRVDMAIIGSGTLVAVECDGYAYHDAQASLVDRDRQRDRALSEAGYTVIRYTGQEINADPAGCAREAVRIAVNGARRTGSPSTS